MSMHQFIEVLKARWRGALAIWVGAMLLTLIASLATPSQYTATASVLVDMKNADPLSPQLPGGGPGAGYMSTQTDIVLSERVAHRVIQALGLDKAAIYHEQWKQETGGAGDFNSWLAQLLQKKLTVLPTRESGVMWISFTSHDPNDAATVANAYVQAYMATTLDLRIEPARQYSSFFDARAKTLSEALRAAQARLSSYQRDSGILVSDERLGEPATNQELFALLARNRWTSPAQVVALRAMAGFRNVLVHGYADVDRAIVRDVAEHHLDDLLGFVAGIRARLAAAG